MSRIGYVTITLSLLAIFSGVALGGYLAAQRREESATVQQNTTNATTTSVSLNAELPTDVPNTSTDVIPGGDAMYGAQFVDPQDTAYYVALARGESSSSWEYVTSLLATAETGEEYDQGAFCRLFPRPDGAGYDMTYGGSFGDYERNYQGVVHRLLGTDLTFAGDPELFEGNGGGDIAIDSDGEYYYIMLGAPKGWVLRKYDLEYAFVDEVYIDLPEGHANNDQTLRYMNGHLIAGDLYNPSYDASNPTVKADPSVPTYSHYWVYTTDLAYVRDIVLDDTRNINGATVVYYDNIYAVVTADTFVGSTLIAMLYDEDWNYLQTLELQDDAQWSMGGMYRDGLIYIAYHKGPHSYGDTYVDVYTTEWELQETIKVTAIDDKRTAAMHPWITFDDDRMFVAYSIVQEFSTESGGLGRTLSCVVSVYDERVTE